MRFIYFALIVCMTIAFTFRKRELYLLLVNRILKIAFQADQICYAVLCVFSFAAAARNHSENSKLRQKSSKKQHSSSQKPLRPPMPSIISGRK